MTRKEKSMNTYKEVYLTRCPVGNATEIAVQKGWLFEDLKREGVALKLLQDLPPEQWESHFTHEHRAFFRDGGNIPPIWARSNGADTKVIGLNFNERRGGILVAKDAPFQSVADLKGKRFGLPVREHEGIDFWRATTLKAAISAFKRYGLTEDDLEIVPLPIHDPYIAHSKADAYWDSVFLAKRPRNFQRNELTALHEGRVDAIYSTGAWGERAVLDGIGRYIYDFLADSSADRVNIEHPSTITVSGELARNNPEIVVAFLRILIRSANWAKDNFAETVDIYAKGSWLDDPEAEKRARPAHFHLNLVPHLSESAVVSLEVEKNFLLRHCFIKQDFSVRDWVDDSFLEAALRAEQALPNVA
jgi:ABC-type nitrate/sulfonate/bicarbonate transport system substrate-binding protein